LPSVSSDRRGVVGLLVLLFAITYIDRVCISVAGPRNVDASREVGGDSPAGFMDVRERKIVLTQQASRLETSTYRSGSMTVARVW
jgi:hypothetical protein